VEAVGHESAPVPTDMLSSAPNSQHLALDPLLAHFLGVGWLIYQRCDSLTSTPPTCLISYTARARTTPQPTPCSQRCASLLRFTNQEVHLTHAHSMTYLPCGLYSSCRYGPHCPLPTLCHQRRQSTLREPCSNYHKLSTCEQYIECWPLTVDDA
jgi:hypothetical protein